MRVKDHLFAVIMAGGSGTRLWPVSRENHPKHTLPLVGGKSLFQNTVGRLSGLFSHEKILVVTTREQFETLHKQTPKIPSKNYLLEPEPRGTASVVGLAAAFIHARDPEAIMALFPSDHHISKTDRFGEYMKLAFDVAEMDYLVTLGINPTFPATGYGYIQKGNSIKGNFTDVVFQVKMFKEKPDKQKAREMLKSNDYSWNSGIFVWKTRKILQEIQLQMPELRRSLKRIISSWELSENRLILEEEWLKLKIQTIDYGIMENAHKVAVIPTSGLGWNDIGSWDSLFEILALDENQNILYNSKSLVMNSHGSLVYGNRNTKLVAMIGVEDLIVIDSGDVLLVCKRDKTQGVRDMVSKIKEKDQLKYL